MATENLRWGYRRIAEELRKLRIRIGATTIRGILKKKGHFPDPQKATQKPTVPRTIFVHAHLETMVSCYLFTKRFFTLSGIRRAYVLVLIHIGSCKMFCSPSIYLPDSKWIMQKAHNASIWTDDEGIKPRFLIGDREGKYPVEFDAFWKPDVRFIRIPPKAAKANSFLESSISGTRREVLHHFVCFSRGRLDCVLRVSLRHYHESRPHRGVGRDNTVLDESFVPQTEGRVRCRSELGGILRSYYREAA